MVIDTYSLATQGQNSFDTYAMAVMGYNDSLVADNLTENLISVFRTKPTMNILKTNNKTAMITQLNDHSTIVFLDSVFENNVFISSNKRRKRASYFDSNELESVISSKPLTSKLRIIEE